MEECVVCVARGKLTSVAEHMHHIERFEDAEHLRLDRANLVPVCQRCHVEIEGMGRMELDGFLEQLRKEAE
ncbi:HNH endonuclease [Stieleria magnilauensis]|uniref:HNH endonuclease n=1 Tax=Stieleria magnilauensis TaxID=2527963 RepID=A0ABX5Y1E0_9BACT|nr:HNH endonuclease [Planctomycetes bacterium TBK1r]QDV87010.1 HNH endonuclease [Planctomycetes bacterium TBK1r]